MNKEIIATFRAVTAKPDYLTLENLDPGLGGWGAFNMGIWAACDVIAKEIKKGKRHDMEVGSEQYTELDETAKKAIDMLMRCGADPANAALCTATLLYWSGVGAQCGIPMPNRKLGAVTRMAAQIPSGRISSMPTEKQNNKISGFAATLAIYQAMAEQNLAPYDANFLPLGAGGPVVGHSAIGEDHLFPKLGKKLASIGSRAMVSAYQSAGMRPNRWLSALFGSAAALEIIHPDSYVGEEFGDFLKTRTPETSATTAVEEVGLPKKIHIRGTGEELETAKVIGDLAIILKDSGTPTVVGMIMFSEICSIVQEGAMIGVGRAGGPLVVPLHHWVTAPVLALRMLGSGASEEDIIDAIRSVCDHYFQSESASAANNLLARKAESINRGPLTNMIIRATEPVMTNAISNRATYAYEQMEAGASLEELIGDIQQKLIVRNAEAVAKTMSRLTGKDVEYINFTRVAPGSGRRKHKFAHSHFAFDAHIDVEVKIDGKVYELENVLAKAAPEALMNRDRETIDAISATAMAIIDMMCLGACSMDVVTCACMAAARGMDPEEAVERAVKAGNVFVAIPPSTGFRESVRLAHDIGRGMES